MKNTKKYLVVLATVLVVAPVSIALSMLVTATVWAGGASLFSDAGFGEAFSNAWSHPIRLAAAAVLWMGINALKQVQKKKNERPRAFSF